MKSIYQRIFLLSIHILLSQSLFAQYYGDMYYEMDWANKTAIVKHKVYDGPRGHYAIPAKCNWLSDYTIIAIGREAFKDCKYLSSVSIPSTITSIGANPFNGCPELSTIEVDSSNRKYEANENVLFSTDGSLIRYAPMKPRKKYVIPNSVTSIYSGAFSDCAYLTSVEIPNSVTSIGNYAFSNCAVLESINIPNSTKSIEGYAFSGCIALKSIEIPYSVISIEENAFASCKALTSVKIPSSITSINSSVFSNCSSLRTIDIPETVTSIGRSSFSGCVALSSIEIPNSLKSIGDYAFANCSSLRSFDIPTSITSIQPYTFYECKRLAFLVIPNSITSIRSSAFENCSSLESIDLPKSLISIESAAFKGCSSLNSIRIPDSVTSIGSAAFANCKTLVSIDIPNSVSSIGFRAFYDCTGLKSIYYNSSTPIECDDDVFTADLYENATLFVPIGARDEFENVGCWWNFKNIVEYDFPGIPADRVVMSQDSVDLTVNESIQLTATVLPEDTADKTITWTSSNENVASVDSIGLVKAIAVGQAVITATCGDVSSSCLVNVKPILAQSLMITPDQWIGEEKNYFLIQAIVLPTNTSNKTLKWESSDEGVASVDCQGMVSVHKGGNCVITVSTLDGSNLKAECTVTSFDEGQRDFTYTYQSQTVVYTVLDDIAKTCKTKEGTDSDTHCGNSISGDLILPEKVFNGNEYYTLTSIGENSFYGCGDLTSVEMPNTVTSIGRGAFFECSKLSYINIPNSVEEIGSSAFALCESISDITIPESVSHIGSEAFKVCRSLTAFRIPSSITEIESGTFYLCTGLRHITIPSSVTKIHYGAFQQCTALESVVFEGDMIDMIEQTAFAFCNKLSKVVFPFYLNCIDASVFRDCSLSNIWLNFVSEWSDIDGYGEIHMDAFKGNPISNIYSCSPIPAKLASTAFDNFSADLYVLDEYKESYLNSTYKWKDFTNTYSLVLPESISIVHMEGALDHVKQGDQIQLTAMFNPDETSFKSIYWESSNPEVATVDQNGLVTVICSSDSDEACHITAYSLCSLWKASIDIDPVDLDGVDEIMSDNNPGTIEVYDLNGKKIAHSTDGLSTGFYILKRHNKSTKLFIHKQ